MPSDIRFKSFPLTEPPPAFMTKLVEVFRSHEAEISTTRLKKGLTSDGVLGIVRDGLVDLGFNVESGKTKAEKVERPVFFGENGVPELRYEIDAFHARWECGLEIEAGRGWMGNAFYRDLLQAAVMVDVKVLVIALANGYRYTSGSRVTAARVHEPRFPSIRW